jgi:hypothetical protein
MSIFTGLMVLLSEEHERMARGGHGLPKVSPGPTMPYPFTPLQPFQRWSAYRAGSLRPSSTPKGARRHTPMIEGAKPGMVAKTTTCVLILEGLSKNIFQKNFLLLYRFKWQK